MTDPLLAAATALADVLNRENQALAALDLDAAAMLESEKRSATTAFLAAQTGMPATDATALLSLAEAGRTLAEAAAANRKLLERAMAVQAGVMTVLARAAPRAAAAAPRYGAAGTLVGARKALPVALATRA